MPFRFAGRCAGVVLVAVLATVARGDDEQLVPRGAVFVPSATALDYVEQPVVQNDLQLTREQQARIAELRARLVQVDADARANHRQFSVDEAIANSSEALARLGEILNPDQIRRHRQIVMQHLLIRFGLVQLVQAIDVAEDLALDDAQRQQLQQIVTAAGYGESNRRGFAPRAAPAARAARQRPPGPPMPANRPRGLPPRGMPQQGMPPLRLPVPDLPPQAVLSGGRGRIGAAPQRFPGATPQRPSILDEFTNPDLTGGDRGPSALRFETANDQISALLTAPQKKRLLEALGPPLALPPSGFAPAVLREGTKQFAFPRAPLRDASDRSAELGRASILGHPLLPLLLSQPAVRGELKLSSEVAARLPPFSGDAAEIPRFMEEVVARLQPEQVSRLQQLVLQVIEWNSGPLALLEFKEVVAALGPDERQGDERQRTALAERLRSDRQSTRRDALAAVERHPQSRPEFDAGTAERLGDLLTAEQRERLKKLVGEPFGGKLSTTALAGRVELRSALRARVAPALGYLAAVPTRFLNSWRIQQVLQLAPESSLPDEDRLLKVWTRQQERRYTELVLQGSIRSDGPAVVLRYRPVTEALALSADQERRLLEVLWDDTRRYLEMPQSELAERQPDLDKATSAAIDAILSAEQRDRLSRFLGEHADDIDPGAEGNSAPGTAAPAPGAASADRGRRLVYPVIHGSARDLAEIVRQHFRASGDVQAEAGPAGNTLLLAAPESLIGAVRAALPQLDRPRRSVIIDLLLFESPLAGGGEAAGGDAGAAGEGPLNIDLTGSVAQVAARLEELSRQKKISGLRQLRLETLEDQAGMLQAGREVSRAAGANNLPPNGFATPFFRAHSVGTLISATPRVAEAGRISLELLAVDSNLYTPKDADEVGLGQEGLLIPHSTSTTRVATTVTVPPGEVRAVKGIRVDPKDDSPEVRIIVAVRFAESGSK